MMKGPVFVTFAAAWALAIGCATGETAKGPEQPTRAERGIASLDAALEAERDETKVPALVYERGHAYLEAAERVRDRRGEKMADGRPSTEFAAYLLGAVKDFEEVASGYPASPEAPEALFHMGIAYDHPNLSSFGVAMKYYRLTIERYPGTESAEKAGVALGKLEARMKDVQEGRHGGK